MFKSMKIGNSLWDLSRTAVVKNREEYNLKFSDIFGKKFRLYISNTECEYILWCILQEKNDRLYKTCDFGENPARDSIQEKIIKAIKGTHE